MNPNNFEEPEIKGIFEFEWETYINNKVKVSWDNIDYHLLALLSINYIIFVALK